MPQSSYKNCSKSAVTQSHLSRNARKQIGKQPEVTRNCQDSTSKSWYPFVSTKVKVKVLLLYSAAQLNQMVSVVLYNLTPGRWLTQPWCEPSPWGDQSRWAAYIPCRASSKCLSFLCCQSQFYTLVRWGTHGVHILPKDVTAQLGPVTYHTMEQCWQDGHPSMY